MRGRARSRLVGELIGGTRAGRLDSTCSQCEPRARRCGSHLGLLRIAVGVPKDEPAIEQGSRKENVMTKIGEFVLPVANFERTGMNVSPWNRLCQGVHCGVRRVHLPPPRARAYTAGALAGFDAGPIWDDEGTACILRERSLRVNASI